MLSASWPSCVDLSLLPREGRLRNVDHAVVDGDSFDGSPTPDHVVRESQDPRLHTDAARGEAWIEEACRWREVQNSPVSFRIVISPTGISSDSRMPGAAIPEAGMETGSEYTVRNVTPGKVRLQVPV
mgnify:CR=1 FL=1